MPPHTHTDLSERIGGLDDRIADLHKDVREVRELIISHTTNHHGASSKARQGAAVTAIVGVVTVLIQIVRGLGGF